jgi:hypothetical protein
MSGSATCKHCDRPVIWAVSSRGRNIPLDPNPRATGIYVLEATGTDERGRVVFRTRLASGADPLDKRYACHFDTCPKWRAAKYGERS